MHPVVNNWFFLSLKEGDDLAARHVLVKFQLITPDPPVVLCLSDQLLFKSGMIHEWKERRTRGGMMKGVGTHPESICFFFLCSLQSNAIGTEKWIWKERSPLFSYQLLPSLCPRNWRLEKTHCSSRRFAHDFCFVFFCFFSESDLH